MSVAVDVDISGDRAVQAMLARLGHYDLGAVLDGIGARVESQTHKRIEKDKTAPTGEPWAPWSNEYKKTRKPGQSLEFGSGALDDSIAWEREPLQVAVGTPMIYGAAQDLGYEENNLVARQFLGLSKSDSEEVEKFVRDEIAKRGGLQ